jgi:hypothetical protein
MGELSEDNLTESQYVWCQMQLLIDDGLSVCPSCETLQAPTPYCGTCGARWQAEVARYTCTACRRDGLAGPYCPWCGALLYTPESQALMEALDEERFDWEAWERGLTTFMQPLSAKEQALIEQSSG